MFPLQAAQVVAKRASQIAPKDTGFMADHITVKREGDATMIVSEAPYSVHVEFGTYKMAAQPFMRPAGREVESDFLKAVAKAVREEIRQAIR